MPRSIPYHFQATLSQSLLKYWNAWKNLGIQAGMDNRDVKKIQFTNIISLLAAIGVWAYAPYTAYCGHHLIGIFQFIDGFLVLLVPILNYRKLYVAARMAFLIIVNSFILINACLIGKEAHVQDFFILSNVTPFLVFKLKEKRYLILGCTIAVFCYLLYFSFQGFFTAYNPSLAQQHIISQINVFMEFALFSSSILLLAKYNVDIEKSLAESNQQLADQAAILKRSNEDLEQFAYVISHDLKVPAQHFISYMRIIREREGESLSNTSKDLTLQAEKGAERVTRLIDDLLSYCRIDNKLGETVTVDCSDLLNSLKEELYHSHVGKEIKIDILSRLPRIERVHHSMIYRVFLNLISNGLKFNKSEIPRVSISCTQEDNKHVFCIKDNGIGLNAGGKPMFQMFRRLHTESEFQGTGIGLATCKKIVNYYKGEIWYESSANGTTFFFTLPVF